jgi:serpin B
MNALVAAASLLLIMASSLIAQGADPHRAARATNELGLDLQRKIGKSGENLCLSPYSIEMALAMTFGGADGETRSEMSRVLHFGEEDDSIHTSFAALQQALAELPKQTGAIAASSRKFGGPSEPITLAIANRLFAQKGYEFRPAFLSLVKQSYAAPLEPVDFKSDATGVARQINDWVAKQTRDRIRDLIPLEGLDAATRMVLANAKPDCPD